jgi:alpha-ketoglutarate-dependent taurine dioxygenase
MNTPLNAFVTETNVELYLSKAYQALNVEERDLLLRLVATEEALMGKSREHMDNGQRRLQDCEQRLQQQRDVVATLAEQGRNASNAQFVLETYERTVVLLRGHQQLLLERFRQAQL